MNPLKTNVLIVIAIIAVGFVVYSDSLANQFTYDDFDVIVNNNHITQFSNLR